MNTRRALYEVYWKARGVITPTLRHPQYLYEEVLTSQVSPELVWLDLGCGHQILRFWRAAEEARLARSCKTIVGLDYDLQALQTHPNLSLKVRGDITRLPFKAESFDLVTANMVVEHLDDPPQQFQEVQRILKPGGTFTFHTPNKYGHFALMRRLAPTRLKDALVRILDGRSPEDVFEVHYKANSRKAIKRIAEASGLEVMRTRMIVSDAIFALVLPVAVVELLWIKLLMTRPMAPLRTNIIATLRKPGAPTRINT